VDNRAGIYTVYLIDPHLLNHKLSACHHGQKHRIAEYAE
jgi:hypothetical protein